MKMQRSRVTALMGLLALIAGSIQTPAQAQERRVEKKPEGGSIIETPVPVIGPPDRQGLKTDIASTLKFLEAKFAFDKLVKGAPYSAVGVTETTQTLSDGNQITRKSEVTMCRDSEGRTRREQTVEGVKNWPAAGDQRRIIFINDPTAGYSYVLDPQTRAARKTGGPGPFKVKPGGPFYNEKAETMDKLDKAGRKMATKQDPTDPGGKKPWISSFIKGPVSNTVTGISAENSMQEAVLNIDEVLHGIVRPDYDEAAKTAGAQGSVKIRFVIDETGAVESMTAEEGSSPFLESALAGAKQIRFRPLIRDGKASRNQGTITFRFTLLPAQPTAADGPTIARPVKPAPRVNPASDGGATIPRPVKSEISVGAKKTESLGKQIIQGIEAEGTLTTLTIPAGEIGNRLPIEITDERWYSPELQTLVMSKHHDPRSGDTIYRLTNINRSEPDRSLFEIPSDYTVNDLTKPRPVERMKKPEDER